MKDRIAKTAALGYELLHPGLVLISRVEGISVDSIHHIYFRGL